MQISVKQFNPLFGETEKNFLFIIDSIRKIPSQIILFPELALTGYDFHDRSEAEKFALSPDSSMLKEFEYLARVENKILCIGFAEKSGDKIYNSAGLFFPESKYNNIYRKTHLFYKERLIFDETDRGFFVVDYEPWDIKIGTMICYDWRFPESSRTLALMGADIILCPSNLVTDVWHIAMPARALENKVYLAVANRIGKENRNGVNLVFKGKSAIYGYNGEVLEQAKKDTEEVLTTEIEPEKTRNKSFNEINNIFSDRRAKWYFK
ncbi:MAG: nitrilase-related carbon-nitrogen hydrolase [bacterium]